jgi:prevent-host-death family protein
MPLVLIARLSRTFAVRCGRVVGHGDVVVRGPVEGGEHGGHHIAHCSNWCYVGFMSSQPEITQRDLRMRSKEIMDAVEHGQAFTVTRDGRSIGELVPLRQRRRFVSRAEFVAMSRTAPAIDADAFRADQDAAADQARGAYDQ